MGYRDDFYVAANVIGYSGTLRDFPSVYFQSGTEYGHITQKHDISQNVGRGTVRPSKGYSIGNMKDKNGTLRLVEAMNGKIMHVSRSTLTPVSSMSGDDKAVLYQAIYNYPNEKLIDGYSDNDLDLIDGARDVHAIAMNELLSKVPKA